MFWGLSIEPGKRYMQTVGKSFHLSMACLERTCLDDTVSLMLDYEGQEYVLCHLVKNKVMQCQLDLNFAIGEKIAFYSAGKSKLHLSGYVLEEDLGLSDEEEDEDDEEEEETIAAQSPVKKRKEAASSPGGNKKPKLEVQGELDSSEDEDDESFNIEGLKEEDDDDDDEDDDEDEDDEDDDDDEDEDSDENSQPNILNKSQQAKTPQGDKQKKKDKLTQSPKTPNQQNGQVQTPQSGKKKKNKQAGGETPKTESPSTPQKKVLQGGVVVQDVKVGSGPVAKPGRQVSVFYVGRLKQNNKQFDASTTGPGFKFNLGRSEVIKGWDVGVAGMRVGGKRTITVPPQMAYGKKGQPPVIPPNSVLVFDVELKNVH